MVGRNLFVIVPGMSSKAATDDTGTTDNWELSATHHYLFWFVQITEDCLRWTQAA